MGLEHIEENAFCGMKALLEVILSCNRLSTPPELCASKHSITMLWLDFNNISFDLDYFKGYRKLKTLYLNHNSLTYLPELSWIRNSLEDLYADHNRLQSLETLLANGLFPRLEVIDVGGNMISDVKINASVMGHMPKLSRFDVYANEIAEITDFWNYYVGDIDLLGIQFHCGPELSWMGEGDETFELGLTCVTPNCMRGRIIADMGKYDKNNNLQLLLR